MAQTRKRREWYLLTLNKRRWLAILLLLVDVGLIVAVNSGGRGADFQTAWLITVVLLTSGIMVIGGSVNGRLEGVLIDNRNRVSLSKFQATLWSILVISTLICVAGLNIANTQPNPLEVQLPVELLFAMGISATSFVAAPSLLSLKADQSHSAAAMDVTAQRLDLAPGDAGSTGKVFELARPDLASWTDMFRGDEVSNAAAADLGKVQQFAITLLLVGVYAAAVWSALDADLIRTLPKLDEGFVTLMGISHASYLAYKAAPHGGGGGKDGGDDADPRLQAVG